MNILITCPPMLGCIDSLKHFFTDKNINISCPNVIQTIPEKELIKLVPNYDGWIIGDDPATKSVFEAGKRGKLKAAIKWGVGVDNVDFDSAKQLGIKIENTPGAFGKEVADIAMSYVTSLARDTFLVDREIRKGKWPKPCGISLADKVVALLGLGDIGSQTAKRLLAADMKVIAYDPGHTGDLQTGNIELDEWPNRINMADYIVLTCSLTNDNQHIINEHLLSIVKPGVRIVNVARGPLIDEVALEKALSELRVHSAALDVFEQEPLQLDSELHKYENCVFGSHNSSNTYEAVIRTSKIAIDKLFMELGV